MITITIPESLSWLLCIAMLIAVTSELLKAYNEYLNRKISLQQVELAENLRKLTERLKL